MIVLPGEKQGTKVRSIDKFMKVMNTLFVAVCLFRDKTNLTLQKSIIWGVTNIGSIVRDIYGK
jgi:hypothetical protein